MQRDAVRPGRAGLRARDLLRWCFRPATRELGPVRLRESAVEAVGPLLSHHRGWGLLHSRRDLVLDPPPGLLEAAQGFSRRILFQQMNAHADLVALADRLGAAGVPWLMVKGPVLAELSYAQPEQRPYGDLDVLVSPGSLRAAVAALEAGGWVVLDRNWTLALHRMVGELHLTGPLGTLVDLHWSLQNRESRRRQVRVGTSTLFERGTTVTLRGLAVRTLSPADTLVHLCLHAAGDGADRLMHLADIAALLPDRPDGWAEVLVTAQEWGVGEAMAIVLQRTAYELDVDVPAATIRRLSPSPGPRLAETAVHRLWPVAGAAQPHGPAARWARWRLDGGAVHWPMPHRRRTTVPFTDSPADPGSVLHDAGGAAGRELYLRAVEATAP